MNKIVVKNKEEQIEFCDFLSGFGFHWKSGQTADDIPVLLKLNGDMGQIMAVDFERKEIAFFPIEVYAGTPEYKKEVSGCMDVRDARKMIADVLKNNMNDKNFYFTFGSDPIFPYCRGYLIVKAVCEQEAFAKFRAKYPDVHPNCLCCAFWYTQEKWDEISVDMGICHEIIE